MQFSVVALLAAGLVAARPQVIGQINNRAATTPVTTAPTPTSTGPAVTCSAGPVVNYAVAGGDTLTSISQKFNSGICNIVKENKLENPNFLALGQALRIPTLPCTIDNVSCLAKPSDNLTCVKGGPATYTIAKGDTFFLVAQKFNLSVNALSNANQGVDPLLLEVGQTIKIPVC